MHPRRLRGLRLTVLALATLALGLPAGVGAQAAPTAEDFTGDTIGTAPVNFTTPVGFWSIGTVDGFKPLLFEDGTQWRNGSAGLLADQAKALYGDRWAEFIDDLSETSYYPTAIYNNVDNFTDGKITMRFMVIGGDVDQDIAILFNYQPSGDYIALRSDTIENNMLLYAFRKGEASSLKRVPSVPTSFAQWHDQTLLVSGNQLAGYLDGRKYLEATLDGPISGRVGVWSKSDTVVLIDSFAVEPGAF
jgi:hypothetical protein